MDHVLLGMFSHFSKVKAEVGNSVASGEGQGSGGSGGLLWPLNFSLLQIFVSLMSLIRFLH